MKEPNQKRNRFNQQNAHGQTDCFEHFVYPTTDFENNRGVKLGRLERSFAHTRLPPPRYHIACIVPTLLAFYSRRVGRRGVNAKERAGLAFWRFFSRLLCKPGK
jgi:hypothetical protein